MKRFQAIHASFVDNRALSFQWKVWDWKTKAVCTVRGDRHDSKHAAKRAAQFLNKHEWLVN